MKKLVSILLAALLLLSVVAFAEGLAVDQHQRDAGGNDLVDDGVSGRGLHQVEDDDVHALGDEGADLVGLLGHVVLAVSHGDLILHVVGLEGLEVVLDLVAIQGHEVVGVLVDGNAHLVGLGFSGSDAERAQRQHGHQQDCE